MTASIISNITKISKDVKDIEKALSEICDGEIIRWAIIGVENQNYIVSFSYKKNAFV